MKIYMFNAGPTGDYYEQAIAICEDGRILGRHLCSHEGFMLMDLTHPSKLLEYRTHCPRGFELLWVGGPNDPRIVAALAANRLLTTEKV